MNPHDEALHKVLQTAQFDPASRAKLPRRELSRGTLTLLVLMRIYIILAIPIVAYAFIRAVSGS